MWNMLSTAALAALVPAVAAETNPDDPKAVAVEKEFRELLKLDDRLHAEVDRWIRDNAALAEANAAISRESLGEQVRIRLRKVEEAYVSFVAKHPKHIEARLAFGGYYSGIGDADKAIGQWVEARDLNLKIRCRGTISARPTDRRETSQNPSGTLPRLPSWHRNNRSTTATLRPCCSPIPTMLPAIISSAATSLCPR